MNSDFDPTPFVKSSLLIETPQGLADFFEKADGSDIIAVDIESAGFYKYYSHVNLIQISTRKQAAIFDPQAISDFSAFRDFARTNPCTWVFHGADYDVAMLAHDLKIFIPRIFDTRKAAELLGQHELGLTALTEKYLGFPLDKRLQRCDWSRRPLTQAMREYGLLDAVCLIPVHDFLAGELKDSGRYEWLVEECESIAGTARAWQPPLKDSQSFRIKGSSRLSLRSMAVLREIWNLREHIASRIDRAAFMLLSNQAMLEIARLMPRSMSGLSVIKSIGREFLARHGHELQEAVLEGLKADLKELELPKYSVNREEVLNAWEGEVAKSLREIRDSIAGKIGLPGSVVAPTHTLNELAKLRPETMGELEQSEILHSWQAHILGDEILPILQQKPPARSLKRRRRRKKI